MNQPGRVTSYIPEHVVHPEHVVYPEQVVHPELVVHPKHAQYPQKKLVKIARPKPSINYTPPIFPTPIPEKSNIHILRNL